MFNTEVVIYINPRYVDEVLDTIIMIGLGYFGKSSKAENLTAHIQSKIDETTEITAKLNKTQRPLVYYELGNL